MISLIQMLPAVHERLELRQIHRFDLLAQGIKRTAAPNLHHSSRAPLPIAYLATAFSAYQLACALPLSESRLDPPLIPLIPLVNLLARYWSGFRLESRQHFASR